MSATSANWGVSVPMKKTKRVWLSAILALAVALTGIALVAAEAKAGSFDHRPPNAVLMKGSQALQEAKVGSNCWNYYDGGWLGRCVDKLYSFPRAEVVRADSRLHIKIAKPQRPERFAIYSYKGFDREQMWPIGQARRLDTTLRRVERDGKTVAWNVFFRVDQPDRHYYLDTFGMWKEVPGTHISYGDVSWTFHVKTAD